MKPYPLIIVCALVGCTQASVTKAPSMDARIDGCNTVYQHVLELTFDKKVDPMHEYDGDKRKWGIHLLDQEFIESKASERFFSFCINRMSDQQVSCAKKAATIEDIDTCNQLVK